MSTALGGGNRLPEKGTVRVALFIPCFVDQIVPRVGMATARLLRRLGHDVSYPAGQTCCGQPAFNSGYRTEARDVARHFLQTFRDAEYVVVPSGSCTGMVSHHYEDLFRKEPEALAEVRRLKERVWEFSEFLLRVAKVDDVGAKLEKVVTYHDSCSGLREMAIKDQPRQLLAALPGLHLRELPDAEVCCGFGGTFSIKYGDISTAIADEKCANIKASGADAVVLGDVGCMLNIEGRLRRTDDTQTRVLHIAQVLSGDA